MPKRQQTSQKKSVMAVLQPSSISAKYVEILCWQLLYRSSVPTYAMSGNTEFHIRNSADFVNSIRDLQQEGDGILTSFDVVSLFTNVPTSLGVEIEKKGLTESDD